MDVTKFVSCVPRSVQFGTHRFPSAAQRPHPPRRWRCELTACSRNTNLYFVAYGNTVWVYEPQFGDRLDSAAIVIYPPASNPPRQGYIDPNNPHDIDRLHVDYLGRKEILLVACDDGDVLGYYVSAIRKAVEKQGNSSDSTIELRPFLHTNVELSAWGLAVHREARLLAISSNSGFITVIAFALAAKDDDAPGHDARREASVKRLNVNNNIPHITFNNNGTDPEGRWLLGATINGDVHLWDLHRSELEGPALTTRLDFWRDNQQNCSCCLEDRHHKWGAVFIDPDQCHAAKSFYDAFGGDPWGAVDGNEVWDISDLKKIRRHRFESKRLIRSRLSLLHQRGIRWLDEKNSVRWLHSDSESPDPYSDMGEPETPQTRSLTPEFVPKGIPAPEAPLLSRWSEELHIPSRHGGWEYRGMLRFDLPLDRTLPNCPYIMVSKNEVYLFQPCIPSTPSTYKIAGLRPIIASVEPLRPPGTVSTFRDRMNYHLYIAELGIFVVAAPESGRCAIFTLTSYDVLIKDAPDGAKHKKTIYGMRQDYTLPFKEQQEDDEFRKFWAISNGLLVGIAAGPVAGSLDKDEDEVESESENESERRWPRLWRLFLHYADHTVLTYELMRNTTGLEPDLGTLIVG